MIKFFRHIRQSMINQNRTKKYLLYAIGEIILVVIGILIALQINNWNANRIQNKKEAIYLNNIKRDLLEQIEAIEGQMQYEQNVIKFSKPIMSYYNTYKEFKIDSSFTYTIGYLSGRRTFVRVAPTYTELLSSGNIDIISNEDFKNKLIVYYQNSERLEQIIDKNNRFTDNIFIGNAFKLSEIQVSTEFIYSDLLSSKSATNLKRMNEEHLKQITQKQLENPENELLMVNLIKFKNFIAEIHVNFMNGQRENTQELINILEEL